MLKFFSLIRSKYWDWHYKYHLKEFEEISSRIKNHPARFITTCTIPFRSKMDKSDAAWNNDLVYSSEGSEIGSGIELFPTSLDPIRIFISLEGSTEGDIGKFKIFASREMARNMSRMLLPFFKHRNFNHIALCRAFKANKKTDWIKRSRKQFYS